MAGHCSSVALGDWCEGEDDWDDGGDDVVSMLGSLEHSVVTSNSCNNATTTTNATSSDLSTNSKAPTSSCEEMRQGVGTGIATVQQYQGPSYAAGYVRVMEAKAPAPSHQVTSLLARYCSDNPDSPVTTTNGGCAKDLEGTGRQKQCAGGGGGGEKYEKSRARHGDKVFLKFQKELANCPQQIIRCLAAVSRCQVTSFLMFALGTTGRELQFR